ncbi:MAG TPA: hypothetical protein VGA55_02445 [Bacteroidota bacterium]
MNRRRFLRHTAAGAALPFLPALLSGFSNVSASIWTYLWDIADEGYEYVLETIRDNGLTSLSVAAAYHAGKFLSPHNPRRKVRFLEDGTVYFQPTAALYGTLKPLVNSLVQEGHHIERVKSEAAKKGLETRAWVVCCHNTPLGTKYPDAACKNVFGDPLNHNLCPSNSDVRRYLSALVADLASKGISVIELEALQFQGYTHGFHHERDGIRLNGLEKFLLGVCCCPSCEFRAREARVDFAGITRTARTILERHFADPYANTGGPVEIQDLPEDLFAPFHQWRREVIASLLEELLEAKGNSETRLRPMVSLDAGARLNAGVDPGRTAAAAGGILVPGYVKTGADLEKPLSAILTSSRGADRVTVGMQVGLPESGGKAEFLDRMEAARNLGIRSFNFYNYGLIPLGNLRWIKESLQL